MPIGIDCNEPSPYITGNWRPSSCNAVPTLIQAIEAITVYLCEEVAVGTENNNFRVVPGGTGEGGFNAYFNGGTPDTDSIVFEGDNIWWTANAGVAWDILAISSFQVGNAGDFADPDNPLPAELRALFPDSTPASNALVYMTHDNSFYETQDSGVGWAQIDYVQTTGDNMTGTLTINVNEIDDNANALTANSFVTTSAVDSGYLSKAIEAFASHDGGTFVNGDGSTAIEAYGFVTNDGGGVLQYARGLSTQLDKSGAGTVAEMTNVLIQTPSTMAGTITNLYGLRVESMSGASNNYAIQTNNGLVVFNEGGDANSDVRIEGDTDTNLLFVDASTNSIGIGTNGVSGKVDIQGTSISQPTLYVRSASGQNQNILELHDFSGTNIFTVAPSGQIYIEAPVSSTPGNTLYMYGTGHTAITASDETEAVYFDLTGNKQWATGAIINQREFRIDAPTYSFVGASTITNATTVYIDRAPQAGTNATITNAYSLWIDAGDVRFDGGLIINEDGLSTSDIRVEGDTDTALFTSDASTDSVSVGIALGSHVGKFHVQQPSTTAAKQVITLQQKDIDQAFIRLIGESEYAAENGSLVSGGISGTIQGWAKIYVQDDAGHGSTLPDGHYWLPLYDTPTF